MSEFRTDPLFGTLSLIATERAVRPQRVRARDEIERGGPCPFCPGNEYVSPPEIARFPIGNGSRWQTRALPNRYPSVTLEAEPSAVPGFTQGELKLETKPGFGAHEVIVDSPSHGLPFWVLNPRDARHVLFLIQSRIRDLYRDRRILYAQVYKDHRASAGASLEHPHFQLIGLSFLPRRLFQLLNSNHCKVCRLLQEESRVAKMARERSRVLTETSRFVALADFAPVFGYQFSIYPKHHLPGFEEAAMDELEDLAQIFTLTLGRFERILGDIGLNIALFTRPNPGGFERPDLPGFGDHSMHWFFRVYPRSGRGSGFELATEIALVHVSPEDAARVYGEKSV